MKGLLAAAVAVLLLSAGLTPNSLQHVAAEQRHEGFYSVRVGDTLTQIAQRNNISVGELRAYNNLGRYERLKVGDILRVPLPELYTVPPVVFSLPLPAMVRLTQGYGCRKTSFARKTYSACNGGEGGFHEGMDIRPFGLPPHAPVSTAADGRVVAVEYAPYGHGKWLAVEHTNGMVTVYAHLERVLVRVGDNVMRGQLIGIMGKTGGATGPHLHFVLYAPGTFAVAPSTLEGFLPSGTTLDPLEYLRKWRAEPR